MAPTAQGFSRNPLGGIRWAFFFGRLSLSRGGLDALVVFKVKRPAGDLSSLVTSLLGFHGSISAASREALN